VLQDQMGAALALFDKSFLLEEPNDFSGGRHAA
jgi:hypothetical protein